MTKRLIIQAFQKDDLDNIVEARTNFRAQHDEAQRIGKPDQFRFIYESDDVDQCTVNASAVGVYKTLDDVHLLIAQEID